MPATTEGRSSLRFMGIAENEAGGAIIPRFTRETYE
jgi:hypothetical protein